MPDFSIFTTMTTQLPPQETTYHYPERFLYSEIILLLLFCTMLIFSWVPLLLAWSASGEILQSAVRAVLFLNIAAVALLILLQRTKKRLTKSSFSLVPHALLQQSPGVHKEINFANVTSITLLRFPFTGGMLVVESATVAIQVPLLLCEIDDLARKLIHGCALEHARFTVQPIKEHLLEICSRVEANNKRAERNFRQLSSLCFRMLPLNLVIGAFLWNMSLLPLVAWMVTGPLFPLGAYAAVDNVLRSKLRRKQISGFSGETDALERTLQVRIGFFAACLYLVTGICFRMIFQ